MHGPHCTQAAASPQARGKTIAPRAAGGHYAAMRTFYLFAGLTLLAPLFALAQSSNATPQAVDGFAAVVNDRIITMGDVLELIQPSVLQMRDTFAGEELERRREEAYKTGLNLLIEQALIVEEFKKSGLTIPDRMVNDRINAVISENFNNDRARFLAALADEESTLTEFQERIRERIIVSAMRQQEVTDKIKVTPEALLQTYEKNHARYEQPAQVNLRMITLRKDKVSDEAALREQAVLLRGKILGGATFAEVAEEFSQDTKASSGGDWGWIKPDDFRAEIRDALKKLKDGEISEILETPEAFLLLQVVERREPSVRTMEEVRPELEKEVRRAEGERIYNAWIDRLKAKYTYMIFD